MDPSLDPIDLDQPRCHHYTLAHQALRSVAFANPLAFLGVLASPDAPRFLTDLLRSVSEHCADREPHAGFTAADLTVHKGRAGVYPCAVVEMPRPRAVAEAFLVAAVLLTDISQGVPDSDDVKVRYFTLEKGMTFEGPPRTVLCEWAAEGSHLNYGDGPEARVGPFVQAIERLLTRDR